MPAEAKDKLVYPGKSWAVASPADAGMDAARLGGFRTRVGGRGCVVRHGKLVYSWGDFTKAGDVASACKPWFVHFLLLLLQQGTIKSLDDPVLPLDPRLKDLNAGLGFKDRKITWRQLANQTSCYGVEEQPGTAYDYSDYNMALFFDVLFLKAYKTTYAKVDDDVLRPRLTDLVDCEDRPSFMAFGLNNRPGRLAMSPRDMCRLGLLYLRKGRWGNKQLLDDKLVTMAVSSPLDANLPRTEGKAAEMIAKQRSIGGGNNQTDHHGSYSFAWWTNGVGRDGKRHWPDAPIDAYGALGHGGIRALVVIPSKDLVVSWNDSALKTREMANEAMKLLVEACR